MPGVRPALARRSSRSSSSAYVKPGTPAAIVHHDLAFLGRGAPDESEVAASGRRVREPAGRVLGLHALDVREPGRRERRRLPAGAGELDRRGGGRGRHGLGRMRRGSRRPRSRSRARPSRASAWASTPRRRCTSTGRSSIRRGSELGPELGALIEEAAASAARPPDLRVPPATVPRSEGTIVGVESAWRAPRMPPRAGARVRRGRAPRTGGIDGVRRPAVHLQTTDRDTRRAHRRVRRHVRRARRRVRLRSRPVRARVRRPRGRRRHRWPGVRLPVLRPHPDPRRPPLRGLRAAADPRHADAPRGDALRGRRPRRDPRHGPARQPVRTARPRTAPVADPSTTGRGPVSRRSPSTSRRARWPPSAARPRSTAASPPRPTPLARPSTRKSFNTTRSSRSSAGWPSTPAPAPECSRRWPSGRRPPGSRPRSRRSTRTSPRRIDSGLGASVNSTSAYKRAAKNIIATLKDIPGLDADARGLAAMGGLELPAVTIPAALR